MIDGLSSLLSCFSDLLSPVVEFIIWVFPIKIYRLHDGERGVILTLGKTRKWRSHEAKPGIALCFMCETLKKQQVIGLYSDMPVQCLYSKDGYALMANMAVIYEITNTTTALLKAAHLEDMVEGIVMDCAREYARTHEIKTIMLRKDVYRGMIKDSNDELERWGVKVTDIVITDLRPHDIMLVGEMLDRVSKAGVKVVIERSGKDTKQEIIQP